MSEELREAYRQLVRELNAKIERERRPINEFHERITMLLHKIAERK